nr:MAG TPA: tail tape measure protein [Caudoviricetes sp.]
MKNDPVYITFEFRGNLEDEVEKITLGIKGLRDESAKTYQRLIADSGAAYGTMSAENRKLAVTVQESINALRDLAVVQGSLDDGLEAGTVTTRQYMRMKAALAVRENSLREAISGGMRTLNERIQTESRAVDSVMALQKRLQELTTAYYNLSKADREGNAGRGILKEIGDLDKEIQTAQSRLSAYSRSAGTGFNGLSMSVQQVARELPSLTMGANMFFLAISNNLPVLADNIRTARVEYDLLKKSGQTAIPVWKQVLTSIVSWQTALVVGITLLSVYGKDIINWVQGLLGADQTQRRLNDSMTDFNAILATERQHLRTLFSALEKTTAGTEGYRKAINEINTAYGKYLPNLLSEKSSLNEISEAYRLVNRQLTENAALKAQSGAIDKTLEKAIKTQSEALTEMREITTKKLGESKSGGIMDIIPGLTEDFRAAGKTWEEAWRGVSAKIRSELGGKKLGGSFYEELEDYVRSVYESEKEISDIQKQFSPFFNKEAAERDIIENKAYWGDIKKQATSVLESIDAEQKKLLDSGKTAGIEPAIVTAYKTAKADIDKATEALKAYDSYEKRQSAADKQQTKEQRAKEAANVIKAETATRELEIERQKAVLEQREKDAELELRQQKINLMKEGSDKELAQIALDYDRKINEIGKKGREYILARQKIEQALWENENPNWKKKGLTFKPSTTSVSQLPGTQAKELSDATGMADSTRDKAEADLLEKTLRQYQDYATKRLEIERKYNEDIAYLTSQRTEKNKEAINAAIGEAVKGKKKALSSLSLDELKDTDMWDKIFGDLDKMALPSLEGLLKQAREVNTSAWDPKNVKEYQDAITRLEEAIRTRSPFKSIGDDWKKLLKAMREGDGDGMAGALEGIDSSVQKINNDLNTIAGGIGDIFGDEAGYAASQVVELTTALGGFATAASQFAQGDFLGGIASVVSSVGSIFSMGKKVKEMNREAREEQQKFYDEAIQGEMEYQRLLRERLRTQRQIGEMTLAYNKRITEELEKQRQASGSEYDRLLQQIQGEQYISGVGYRHGTWFRKAKTWNEYSSLMGKSYEDIEKLYTEGKLEEKVARLFEQLRALREEGVDIDQMLDDQEESMREVLTGTTTDSIADSIIQGFAGGKRSAKDFADDFQEMLNNAVLQGIKMRALEEPLRKWYESFAEASGAGLTESDIADLKAQYDKIVENAAKQLEDMERVTGNKIDSTLTQQARAGAFTTMTQDTASELNGRFTAIQINVSEIKGCVLDMRTFLSKGLEYSEEIARNTSYCKRLDRIDRTLLEILTNGLKVK